jgi:hypothetical protein
MSGYSAYPQAGGEVWAKPIAVSQDKSILTVLFTTTPAFARDPVVISRWTAHAVEIAKQRIQPRSPVEHALAQFMTAPTAVNAIVPLARQAEAGIDLFGTDVAIDPQVMGAGCDPGEHNASLVRLAFHGYEPYVAGMVGADVVAMERLAILYRQGGQPVITALVQANFKLHERGRRGNPGLVVVSFDPQATLPLLEQAAEAAYALESTPDNPLPPHLLPTARAVMANEEGWCYHRRVRMAPELTQGRVGISSAGCAMYLADLWFHRPFLADGYLSDRQPRLLGCLAQPGDQGGIELIPHDRLGQFWSGPQLAALQLRPG